MSIHNLMHVPAINDCPFCHKEGCVLNSSANDNLHWVSCEECGANGPAEQERESAINYWNGIGDDITALRDALWVCVEHNRLHFGESHNTVIQGKKSMIRKEIEK